MGSIDTLFAGIFSSCALIYLAPAALPVYDIKNVSRAFYVSLSLAAAFLLTGSVYALSGACFGDTAATLICVLFAFLFGRLTVRGMCPESDGTSTAVSAAVLVLTQPAASDWGQAVMTALGTAAGIVIIMTALSAAVKRISLSEAPHCIKGLPSALLILGLAALAFDGF